MKSSLQGERSSRPRHLDGLRRASIQRHVARMLGLTLSLGALMLHAEVPKLDAFFPAGGQIGSSFTVTTSGKLDEKVRLWTDDPGIHFVPTGKKQEWQTTLTSQARPGLHLVYALNHEGVAGPQVFSVGHLAEITEVEPNDEVGKGQALKELPVCINARLDKGGDVDGYSLDLKAGQTLVALVEAYALGSPVDVMAHVIDPDGLRILTASDGRNLDPFISYTAPKTGRYTLQLAGFVHPPKADIKFTGGSNVIYRLHVSTGPVVTQIHPAAISSTGKTEVQLLGYNLDPKKTRLTADATQVRQEGKAALISPADSLQPIQVLMVDKPATMEKEPNNSSDKATPIQIGTVAGQISDKADQDHFVIPMKKGEKLQARLYAKQFGLPLDATLRVESPDGQVLTTAIDQGEQPDPVASWTATVEGPHQIIVEDQFHRGGPNHHYVLEIGPAVPTYAVTLPERKPVKLAPGKTLSVKVNVKPLNSFKGDLILRAAGLPIGVHAADVPVPAKGGDVEIKLKAASDAPASTQPITFQVWTHPEPATQITADYPLRSEDVRGTTLLDRASWFWLELR